MNQVPVTSPSETPVLRPTGNPAGYPARSSIGSVSSFEKPDRPGFRSNFNHWWPIGRHFKPNRVRAVLKLPMTRPTYIWAGLTIPRINQMFGPMPLLPKGSTPDNYQSKSLGFLPRRFWICYTYCFVLLILFSWFCSPHFVRFIFVLLILFSPFCFS